MITATISELQNNFDKYLKLLQSAGEVIVLKNGKEVARLVSPDKNVSFLTDSLIGVLAGDYDAKTVQTERMEKYEDAH